MKTRRLGLGLLAALGILSLALGCQDRFFAPATSLLGGIKVLYALPASASGGEPQAFDKVDAIHVQLATSSAVMLDTTFAFVPNTTTGDTHVQLVVDLQNASQNVHVDLELSSSGKAVFAGTDSATLVQGETTPVTVEVKPVVAALQVTTPPTLTALGDTVQMHATAFFATGDTVPSVSPNWTSLTPGIVTVTSNGLAVADSEGQARLEARLDSVVQDVNVTVAATVASITLLPQDTTVPLGAPPFRFLAVARDRHGNALVRTLAFRSSAPAVATMDSTGLATILSVGTTTITASFDSLADSTSLTVSNQAPQITSLVPSSATAGGPAFTLRVLGSGFIPADTVNWGGSARPTTYVGGTELDATIGAPDIARADTIDVTVFAPPPGGGTSSPVVFTVDNPAPQITSLVPSSATAGGPAFTLHVLGSGFMPASTVNWGGSPRATTYVSGTELDAAIGASDIATAGTIGVAVSTPGPGGGTSASAVFTVGAPAAAGTIAYVTNSSDSTVSVIDVATGRVTQTIGVGSDPVSVAFTPDGTQAYVANEGSAGVSVIDVSTGTVTWTVSPVGSGPSGVAFTPDGTQAYVTAVDGSSVYVIDVASSFSAGQIPVGSGPTGVAFTPDGTQAYVADAIADSVSVIDVATSRVTQTVGVGAYPVSVALKPDGTQAYVVDELTDSVSVIDVATSRVSRTIPVGDCPTSVAFTPDGTEAYVVDACTDSVSVIDVATGMVTRTIPVGTNPQGVPFMPDGVAFTPDGKEAYVTNGGSNSVSVIEVATGLVTQTIGVGSGPYGVAIR